MADSRSPTSVPAQSSRISRRRLLQSAGVLLAAALPFGLSGFGHGTGVVEPSDGVRRLLEALDDLPGIRDIGAARLADLRSRQGAWDAFLVRAPAALPASVPETASPAQVAESVWAAAEADYAAARIVPIGGWLLSTTEADLCALVALEYGA